jgi:hypothetical protein
MPIEQENHNQVLQWLHVANNPMPVNLGTPEKKSVLLALVHLIFSSVDENFYIKHDIFRIRRGVRFSSPGAE